MTISQESVSIVRDGKGVITHIIVNDMTSRHTLIGKWEELSLEEAAEVFQKGIEISAKHVSVNSIHSQE